MYLAELPENEKKYFWKLANLMVGVDGNITETEVAMLEEYQKELNLREFEPVSVNMDEIISGLQLCEKKNRKIIFFELLGLVYADKDYSDDEKRVMRRLKESFGISDEEERIMNRAVESIMNAYLDLGKMFGAE